jgi:phosphatidylinositol-4,5-bisphosphate 4-phosphatase
VSVSLVSPGKLGDEGDMWAQQRAAYEKANANGLTMTADPGDGKGPREITVKPNILAFSTPVNSLALDSALLRPFLGGLSVSQQANNASITGLIGSSAANGQIDGLAGKKLKDIEQRLLQAQQSGEDQSALIAHRDRITGLVDQVRQIMNEPAGSPMSWQRAGNEPYKLASRLTALANEVGAVPAFNCKSGKDRTGELDVQVKQLYAHNHHEVALSRSRKTTPRCRAAR